MIKSPKSYIAVLLLTASIAMYFIWGLPFACRNDKMSPQKVPVSGEILGAKESCMQCHSDYAGFEASHNPENIGCSPCHLGNPLEQEKNAAHTGMVLVPGNLSDVRQTCGTANCHAGIAERVENSLMTSMAGVIAVNRFVFGESDTLSAHAHVHALRTDRAADVHLRQLCSSCHLGNEKTKPAPVGENSRGGGCIACHLDYSKAAAFRNDTTKKFHPAVNLNITNDHCFGCHSRSGRISTNYEGWHETKLDAAVWAGKKGYRILADGRVFRSAPPDVHHTKGLECIDCHSSEELMGDGQRYFHAEEAVKIGCRDCHFESSPPVAGMEKMSVEAQKILLLRKADYLGAQFVLNSKTGAPLSNVFFEKSGKPVMAGKNSGKRHPLKSPAEVCTRGKAHDAMTCSACHTGWAPQCLGCHNTYEPAATSFDHLTKKATRGKWVEHLGEFFADQPTLGVVLTPEGRQIKPFVPGMILTIDKSGFPVESNTPEIFQRLFAPAAPHTTAKEGRSCTSCHNNPLAMGYGSGTLNYRANNSKGRWYFNPDYANRPEDGLPEDAWIGFLSYPSNTASTRPNARPFTVAEQQKILQVGACLTCHDGNSKVMKSGMEDFEKTLHAASKRCVLPEFQDSQQDRE